MGDHVRNELIKGLTAEPKYIPHWYMYDKDGSLYYDICCEKSKWFYYHRYETELLQNNIQDKVYFLFKDIVGHLNETNVLVDLGSGKALKTRILIDGLLETFDNITYVPVDISVEYLGEMVTKIKEEYGDELMVKPLATDYLEALDGKIIVPGNKIIVWLGGSLQNLSYNKQIQDLTAISRAMQSKDRLFLTVDVTDSSEKTAIEHAYLDPEGYLAKLHLNGIHRINRELDGNIDKTKFKIENELIVKTNQESCSYITVWAEAKTTVSFVYVSDLDLTVTFQRGEKLFLHEGVEMSCKYTIEQIKNICKKSSLSIISYWTNEHVIALMLRRI